MNIRYHRYELTVFSANDEYFATEGVSWHDLQGFTKEEITGVFKYTFSRLERVLKGQK